MRRGAAGSGDASCTWGSRLPGRAYSRVVLRTFAGLDAARHLYEAAGFTLVEEGEDATWEVPVLEQIFVLPLEDD